MVFADSASGRGQCHQVAASKSGSVPPQVTPLQAPRRLLQAPVTRSAGTSLVGEADNLAIRHYLNNFPPSQDLLAPPTPWTINYNSVSGV